MQKNLSNHGWYFFHFFSLSCKFKLIQFLMVLEPFVENFEARIEIYASKLIKQLYRSTLKNQDQNFDVTFSVIFGTVWGVGTGPHQFYADNLTQFQSYYVFPPQKLVPTNIFDTPAPLKKQQYLACRIRQLCYLTKFRSHHTDGLFSLFLSLQIQ